MRISLPLCAAVILGLTATAMADPANSSWFARAWETEDGLPNNNVNSLAQTPDGFLWIATPLGLARFDGLTFDDIPLTSFAGQANRGVAALLQHHAGELWLEMDRGEILDLNAGKVTTFIPTNEPLSSAAQTLVESDDGTLWVSYSSGVIAYLKDGKMTIVSRQSGLPWARNMSVVRDIRGRIWLALNGGVGIFRDGRFHSLVRLGGGTIRLAPARSGGVWICAGAQLFRFDEGVALEKAGELAAANSGFEPSVILEDHQGAVWIGTAFDGLYRFDGEHTEKIPTTHPEISSLLEDSEGNIWVGTHGGGLNRLRRRVIALENAQNGLPFQAVESLCEDTGGTLWAVTQNGLLARRDASGWQAVSTNADWQGGITTCVAADPDGSVWIGMHNDQLAHWQNGRFDVWDRSRGLDISPISALMVDNNGDLWIGGVGRTLQFLHAGHFRTVPLPANSGSIRAITQGTGGAIWIGTSRGLLLRIIGTNVTDETEKNSVVPKSIRCLCSTPDGSLWIGYAGFGLGCLKSGHLSRITSGQGLFDDYVSQIVPDGRGWIWFGGDRGIFKVRETDLQQAAENPRTRVRSIHYGRGEGLPGLQATFEFAPGAIRSHDGRIWIPTQSALVVVNPQDPEANSKPPPVFLKSMVVDGKTVAAYGGPLPVDGAMDLRKPVALKLPPDHRDIEFDFTALGFSAPENVRLQYRLDGLDNDWIDSNPERRASFSRLPAGNYCFRVRAGNNEGIWNTAGAALAFAVTPFLWQRLWFQALIVLLLAAIIFIVVRYIYFRRLHARLRSLEQQAALAKERSRIARDLHDDLGSNLTEIILLSDLMAGYPEEPGKSVETARRVSTTARRIIKTLDETVWAVNPRNDTLPHLVDYIGQYSVEFLRAAGIRCHMDIPLSVPTINVPAEVRHNLFLVVKEALNNVVNHADAKEVWLQVVADERAVRLVIEDNGRGFEQAPDNSRADGLRNMRQRIEEVGGEFDLQSKSAGGTRIAFEAPLNHK